VGEAAEAQAVAAHQSNQGQEEAAEGDDNEDEDEEEEDGPQVSVLEGPDGLVLELVELTCGGYHGKVQHVDFGVGVDGEPLLASCGGNACMVWNFGGEGPAGSAPTIMLGHTKQVDCSAWHGGRRGVLATGGRDKRLIVYEVHNAAEGMEGMPSLCGPAAVDPEPQDEVVAVAWSSGGVLVSAHSSGDVKSWTWAEGAEKAADQ